MTAALLAVTTLVCAATGCLGRCDGETSSDRNSGPWPRASTAIEHVPAEAESAFFLRHLRSLENLARFGADHLPDGAVTEGLPAGLPFSPETLPETFPFDEVGLAPERTAAAYRHDGHWTLVAPVADRTRFQKALPGLLEGTPFGIADDSETSERTLRYQSTPVASLRLLDEHLVVHPITDRGDEPGGSSDASPPPLGPEETWPADAAKRSLLEDLASDRARMVGVAEPSRWFPEADGSTAGDIAFERLAHQLGPTGVRATYDRDEPRLSFDVRSRSAAGEPVVVSKLGSASKKLPGLGGLVEPGVLGVVRFSVDPQSVYDLLVSTLPARRRARLETFWRQFQKKLVVSGPEEILENFAGHAVVVFYGIDDAVLSGDRRPSLRRFMTLQTTREVIAFPITSRTTLERLLDKATQISRGRLSRQQGKHTVQYAWFRDGALQWALILSDEHLLFVDSATSFDKALQFEHRGRELTAEQRESMGIGPLLETRDRSGFFLDAATVGNLLAENDRKRAAAWLAPFQSVLLTTDMDGDVGTARIELVLD